MGVRFQREGEKCRARDVPAAAAEALEPRRLLATVGALAGWLRDTVHGRRIQAFEHELWLCFFAGIVRQRFRDSRARRTAVAHVAPGA